MIYMYVHTYTYSLLRTKNQELGGEREREFLIHA